MINNYINHIVFVVDKSGSMQGLATEIVKVFDSQIQHLATRSKELDQETRVSVYLFDDNVECAIFDKDVLRLPSLAALYKIGGQTALLDATSKALNDLEQTSTLYGDHAFLMYALTDGQENASKTTAANLAARLKKLPENWTVAVLVPNQDGKFEAKKAGFAADNIQVWSTTRDGVREVGEVLKKSTNQFMQARTTGVRGTKSLFNLDASNLSASTVQSTLQELKANEFEVLPVRKDSVIKDFVESWTKESYRLGSAYYMLGKPESIQAYKQICVQNKRNGKVYSGNQARQLLGLPAHEVKVSPASHPDFDLFVQSTSTNRKLQGGTKLLVMK